LKMDRPWQNGSISEFIDFKIFYPVKVMI